MLSRDGLAETGVIRKRALAEKEKLLGLEHASAPNTAQQPQQSLQELGRIGQGGGNVPKSADGDGTLALDHVSTLGTTRSLGYSLQKPGQAARS
jgi:hypothetical protein